MNQGQELIKEPQTEKVIENPVENTNQLVDDNKNTIVSQPSVEKEPNPNTVVTHVVNTFKNSEDIIVFDKFLAIIEGVLAKIQDQLGIDMDFKNPEDAMAEIEKNLPKVKFRLLLTGVILKEMVQDPELQKVWGEFIEIFQDKYFQAV